MCAMASLLFYVRIDWPETTDQPGNPVPVAGVSYVPFWPKADLQFSDILGNRTSALDESRHSSDMLLRGR